MVAAGHFTQARAVWAWVSKIEVGPGTLLFDGGFSNAAPPPPFNWELASSTVGVAERQPGGALHVIFYGQEDGALASHCWSFRRDLPVDAARPAWPGARRGAALDDALRHKTGSSGIIRARPGRERLDLPGAAGCPAQWLELVGSSADMPQQSDVTLAERSFAPGRQWLRARAKRSRRLSPAVPGARRQRARHLGRMLCAASSGLGIIAWAVAAPAEQPVPPCAAVAAGSRYRRSLPRAASAVPLPADAFGRSWRPRAAAEGLPASRSERAGDCRCR